MKNQKLSKRQKLLKLIEDGYCDLIGLKSGDFRAGYCCQCGLCCCNIDLKVPMSEAAADWISMYQNLEVRRISDTIGVVSIKNKCKHLVPDPEDPSKFTCDIYDTRPAPCQLFPATTPKFPECTYVVITPMEAEWFRNQVEKFKNAKT